MFLALAPGGIAETALTGKALGLDVAPITGLPSASHLDGDAWGR
jgi:uncharacterized membrane protein AbrB (regulator of aidB expression)